MKSRQKYHQVSLVLASNFWVNQHVFSSLQVTVPAPGTPVTSPKISWRKSLRNESSTRIKASVQWNWKSLSNMFERETLLPVKVQNYGSFFWPEFRDHRKWDSTVKYKIKSRKTIREHQPVPPSRRWCRSPTAPSLPSEPQHFINF